MITLVYITRVNLSANSAQAWQISCMVQAFYKFYGGSFKSYSIGNTPEKIPDCHSIARLCGYTIKSYFGLCLYTLYLLLKYPKAGFYTRDIMISFTCLLFNRKVAYESHNIPASYFSFFVTKLLYYRNRFKLIVISEALKKYYIERFSSRKFILVAHDGVFLEDYRPLHSQKALLRNKLKFPKNKIIFIHTGSLYKGGGDYFEYILNFRKIYFLHIGGEDKECQYWQKYYTSNGYNNIHFKSHLPHDLIVKYQIAADALFYINSRRSKIFLYTSPLKVFEYMSTGNPILGSNTGSVSEILSPINCFCFDPDNRESISRAVQSLLESKVNRNRIAQNALENVKEKYTWDARVISIVKFLNNVN